MKRNDLSFRPGDGVVIAAVVLTALGMILFFLRPAGTKGKTTARIYQNGAMIQQLSLDENRDLIIGGSYQNTVTVRDGRIAITQSNCPGEDCVHSGWISMPGRSIVCLPNRLEIRIEGTTEDDVDAVVR